MSDLDSYLDNSECDHFLDFSEILSFYHEGYLDKLEDRYIQLVKTEKIFSKDVVYSLLLLQIHLECANQVTYFDDITSAITRCIEYGLKPQLLLLLKNLDRLIVMSTDKTIPSLDRCLLIRSRASLECYLIARKEGFIDIELEERIRLLQRQYRQRQTKLKDNKDEKEYDKLKLHNYKGPDPDKYTHKNYGKSARYYGYRHVWYYLKWNKTQRWRILKLIKTYWWGDCRYQAYVDSIESRDDERLANLRFG